MKHTTSDHRRTWAILFGALTISMVGLLGRPAAADSKPLPVLSSAQQAVLAQVFAPTLVFHRDEEFFPVSSITPLTGERVPDNWSSRVDQYRALPIAEKLDRSALAYRVFTREQGGHLEVVVEYWCYYVFNAYTVKGGWLPYRVHDDHPHDLERLYFVLRPKGPWADDADEAWARATFRIDRVVANAHDGSIAPNQYRAKAGQPVAMPVNVMIERGSHAMAPDINRDGRFTPGVDSSSSLKAQWGIRDRGSTWRWYLASFMDPRDASSVRLCGPLADPVADDRPCTRYALYPAEGLQKWFQELQLSSADREQVVGRASWLMRTFGDVRVEDLIAPTDPPNGHVLERMLRRRAQSETGFVLGFTTVDHSPALVVGRRSFWELPSGQAPDLLVEAVALLPSGGRTLFEATAWGSYRIDAITNVLVGYGWFSEKGSFSPALGSEFRAGRFRVRPSIRLSDGGFDTRVSTTF